MPCPNDHRERSVTVAFRMSPAMRDHIDAVIATTGMTKQDYIVSKLLDESVVVHPSTRVYKALREYMRDIHDQLCRINAGGKIDEGTLAIIELLAKEFAGFGGNAPALVSQTAPELANLPLREDARTPADIDAENDLIMQMGRD